MQPRYSRASELVTFAVRKRAWFLESQGQPTALSRAQAMGTADHHAGRPRAVRQTPATARLAVLLVVLSGIGIACAALLMRMHD
jgi:putative effector of murein hydrolase